MGISRSRYVIYYVAYVYNGEFVPLIGNQRVGIFPPKSKIFFVLSLASIWCRNFQDRTIPVRGDTWPSFWRKELIRIIRKIYICEAVCDAVRKWSEVTRPSADCQTTIFRRFKQLEIFLSKVAERSRDSGRRSHDRRPTVKQRFFGRFKRFGKILKKVAERSRDSSWGHATVGRLSNNVFLDVSSDLGKFWKKSLNGHATVVGGHATVGLLSNNVF